MVVTHQHILFANGWHVIIYDGKVFWLGIPAPS